MSSFDLSGQDSWEQPQPDMQKCIVKGCLNRKHEGLFIGLLCAPCSHMLTTEVIGHGTTFIHMMRDQLGAANHRINELERASFTDRH